MFLYKCQGVKSVNNKNIKEKSFKNTVKLICYGIKNAKLFFVLKIIWAIIKTIKTATVDVLLLQYIIDAITKNTSFEKVLLFIIFCGIITFSEMLLDDTINTLVAPIAKKNIRKKANKAVFKKVSCIDVEQFDDKNITLNFFMQNVCAETNNQR